MHGCSPIYSYVGFPLTAALYDRDLQMQNTLRWSHCVTRADHLRQYLPGYQQIEQAVMRLLLAVFPRWLVLGLGLHNGHMLRQFFAADGGSGFSGHIDEADGASKTLLYLSVIVKLTADPVGAHGTWMQVDGYPPVRYGSVDGAVVIFLSRSKHSSLRTPHNMGKVLKLALFYKFTDPQLIAQYQEVAPPALARGTPLEFSILPSQVPKDPHTPYNLIPSHLTCFVLTSSHLVPSHLIPSHLAPAGFNGIGCKIGCKIHATCKCNDECLPCSLPLCGTMLQPLFDADNEARDCSLQCTRIKGAPLYANPLYGFCSKVHAATVPSLLTVSVRLFDFSLHGPPCTESGPGG